jgi:hypothetical protein
MAMAMAVIVVVLRAVVMMVVVLPPCERDPSTQEEWPNCVMDGF